MNPAEMEAAKAMQGFVYALLIRRQHRYVCYFLCKVEESDYQMADGTYVREFENFQQLVEWRCL